MFQSMSNWLGGAVSVDKKESEELKNEPQEKVGTPPTDEKTENETNDADDKPVGSDEGDDLGFKELEEVSAKALNTAKVWGSYLFSVGKEATKTVTKTALQLKEKAPLISDFQKEQDRFKDEMKKKHGSEVAVPPWVGYNEEESMKDQILALSQDKRNFLRNPPAGVQFVFEFNSMFPVAMATLQEDKNLENMRFQLVPKSISEENFWRNYFYRVSLIKQSTQLTTMAQQAGTDSSSTSSSDFDKLSELQENRTESTPDEKSLQVKPDEIPTGSSPPDNEFISDTFQSDHINEEDIRQEMLLLGMSDQQQQQQLEKTEVLPQWEEELQQELREYDMVDDGADDDIEKEILEQLEKESQET